MDSISINVNVFHTGAIVFHVVQTDVAPEEYAIYAPARPYSIYAYMQVYAEINSDGSLTQWGSNVPADYGFLQSVYDAGKIPIFQVSTQGHHDIATQTLINHFAALHTWLNGRTIIWAYGNEANSSWEGPIDPAVFNSIYTRVRSIIDSNGYTNILLAMHFVPLETEQQFQEQLDPYAAGLACVDILGMSMYPRPSMLPYTYEWSFQNAQDNYNRMGINKPYFLFEFGIFPWGTPLYPEMIDLAYNLLDSYPFIKAFCWYLPYSTMYDGGCMNELALQARNHETETPPIVFAGKNWTVQKGNWSVT